MRPSTAVSVGDTPPGRQVGPITATDIVRFAGAGGDFNPLHHDPEFARTAGLGGVISMGQFQAALLAGWVSDTFGIENLLQFEVRFVAPVRIGDLLDLSGTVVAVDTGSDRSGSTATLELSVRAGEQTVVTGSAVVRAAR